MATDHIRYDLLAQDALRGVVQRVLADAARDGLPGEHHFYISFKTAASRRAAVAAPAEKYPDEITIVLQHQFWDLSVGEHGFEVGLSFSGVPEKLVVPFDAVTGFFDPSVQFGLKFEVLTSEPEESDVAPAPPPVLARRGPRSARRRVGARRGAGSRQAGRAAKGQGGKGEKKAPAKPLKVGRRRRGCPADEGGEGRSSASTRSERKNSPPLCPSPGLQNRGATGRSAAGVRHSARLAGQAGRQRANA